MSAAPSGGRLPPVLGQHWTQPTGETPSRPRDDPRQPTVEVDVDLGVAPRAATDDLEMPERAIHRQTVDLMALAATQLLDPDVWTFRELNWYPDDGGPAVTPDIMVLPRSALDTLPQSYRQDQRKGPVPLVVVEVASETDSFAALRAKARRYQRLGTTTYVVVVDEDQGVLRLGPEDPELMSWTDLPILELGGISLGFEDGLPQLTLPDGTTATSDADLIEAAKNEAAAARDEAAVASERAAVAERRADELLARLRDLGAEQCPDDD